MQGAAQSRDGVELQRALLRRQCDCQRTGQRVASLAVEGGDGRVGQGLRAGFDHAHYLPACVALVRLEQRLDAQHFVRVHRAHIVNLAKVVAFVRHTRGAVVAQLHSGAHVAVSRARAQELRGWVR